MKKTSRQIALGQVCECSQQCLGKICQASDSGLTAQKCWCADCADYRADAEPVPVAGSAALPVPVAENNAESEPVAGSAAEPEAVAENDAKANAYRWRVEVTANGYRTHRFNIDDFNEDGTRTLEN